MSIDYVFWAARRLENVCQLVDLQGVEREWELDEGVPRSASFPDGATLRMDPNYPYHTLLADNLLNTERLIVASGKLKTFLESRQLAEVEYLPVKVLNHKNRPVDVQYYIIHPVNPVDCLDLEQSGPRWSAIDTTRIKALNRFVIVESKIDKGREMFRPKHFHRATLVKRTLAEAIDKEGFTGIRWFELDQFTQL